MDTLRGNLQEKHKEVVDAKEKRRLRAMANMRSTPYNFEVGDFVLWSRMGARLSGGKLLSWWVGPYMMTEAHCNAFTIRHLITGCEYTACDSRSMPMLRLA